MKRSSILLIALLGAVLVLSGCSSNSDGGGDGWPTDEDPTDTGAAPAPGWTIEQVSHLKMGAGLDLEVDTDDGVHVAFFEAGTFVDNGEQCIVLDPFASPVDQDRRNLHYATKASGDADWTVELIDTPKTDETPSELDLEINPVSGEPQVVYPGGPGVGFSYCGANDGVLATRGATDWTEQLYVETSGEAPGPPESTNGSVVGFSPSLAYDSTGAPAVYYMDVHNYVLQADDSKASDAEIYFGPGGGSHEMIDGGTGSGAGDHGSLIFDDQDRAVVFYAVTFHTHMDDRYGVWAARQVAAGTWLSTTETLWSTNIKTATSSAVDPNTGDLVVAFYNGESSPGVRILRLTDHDQFEDPGAWTVEYAMDPRYEEGDHVSMAFAPDGSLALAYHRCKRLTSDGGCNVNDEGLVFAIKKNGKWTYEAVDLPQLGNCGEFASLGFTSDGTAHIAYRCTVKIKPDDTDNAGQEFGFRLFVASKKVVEVP